MAGVKKPEQHLKRVLIRRFVEQLGLPNRKRIRIRNIQSLGEIAGREATSSKSNQVVTLEVEFHDGHKEEKTICLRYSSQNPVLKLRPELTIADAIGVTRIMHELEARLKSLGKDTVQVPSPSLHWIVLKNGRLHRLPPVEEWNCTASLRTFTPNMTSYLSCLRKRQTDPQQKPGDEGAIFSLAELLALIHVKPDVQEEERKPLYRECASNLLARIGGYHNLSLGEHKLLVSAEARGLHCLICETLHGNTGTSDRLRAVWGDMHFGNVLSDIQGHLVPIDPRVRGAFPQVGDAGLDIGFLLTDLWWFYRVFENPVFRELAQMLLGAYEKATGDTKIRVMAAQWGVPYRTAMRLKSEYVREAELTRARPFVQDMQNWMANRCVNVDL